MTVLSRKPGGSGGGGAPSGPAGGDLGGTYPNPTLATGVGAFDLIQEIVAPAGGQASLDFTAIPGTYRHLRITLVIRSERAAQSEDPLMMRFNNDSGSNYDYLSFQFLGTDSGTATASRDESLAGTEIRPGTMPAASSPAGAHAEVQIDIAGYADTVFRKGCTSLCSAKLLDSTGGLRNYSCVGEWRNTAAITRVTFSTANAQDFLEGSQGSLFGVG